MIYKRQSTEKAIIGFAADWKEHAAHIRRQLRNRGSAISIACEILHPFSYRLRSSNL